MFELNKAVDAWCDKVVAYDIWDADKSDELKDHLYCIIEEEIRRGQTEQAAFEHATSAMGYPASAANQNSTHARVIQGVCRVLRKIEGSPAADSPMMIAHAVIWASVMLATALILQDNEANSDVFWILLMGWLASYVALDGTKRSAKQEWACLKQRIARVFR